METGKLYGNQIGALELSRIKLDNARSILGNDASARSSTGNKLDCFAHSGIIDFIVGEIISPTILPVPQRVHASPKLAPLRV